MAERERRAAPHLNVSSSFLVYLWNVPVGLRGRELKDKLGQQIGPIRFIETFEAWNYRPTGHVIVEFNSLASVEFFVEMMEADRIPFLHKPVGFQDLVTLGRRQFFELVYRDTGVDLLGCDGNPPSSEWNRQRPRGMAVRSALGGGSSGAGGGGAFSRRAAKPYERERGRAGASSSGWRRRSESPSPVSPFPSAGGIAGGTLRRFLWSTQAGRQHILTVDELNGGGTAETTTGTVPFQHNNKTQRKLCARVQEMDVEEGEIVEHGEGEDDDDDDELEDGEIVVTDDDDCGGTDTLSHDLEDGELAEECESSSTAAGRQQHAYGTGKRRCASAIGGAFRQRSPTTAAGAGDGARRQQQQNGQCRLFFRSPPPAQRPTTAAVVSPVATDRSSDGAFSRELRQRLHTMFGPPPALPAQQQQQPQVLPSKAPTTTTKAAAAVSAANSNPTATLVAQQKQQCQGPQASRGRRRLEAAASGRAVTSSSSSSSVGLQLLHRHQHQHKETVFKHRALQHSVGAARNRHSNATNSWAQFECRKKQQQPTKLVGGSGANRKNCASDNGAKRTHQRLGPADGRLDTTGGKTKWWDKVTGSDARAAAAAFAAARQSKHWPRKRRHDIDSCLEMQRQSSEEVITIDSDSSSSYASDNDADAAGAIANLRISAMPSTAVTTASAAIGHHQRRRSSGGSSRTTGSSSASSVTTAGSAAFSSTTNNTDSSSASTVSLLSHIGVGTANCAGGGGGYRATASAMCARRADDGSGDGLMDVTMPPICTDEEDDDDGELLESVDRDDHVYDDDANNNDVIEIDQSAPLTADHPMVQQKQQQKGQLLMMEHEEELDYEDWDEPELIEYECDFLQKQQPKQQEPIKSDLSSSSSAASSPTSDGPLSAAAMPTPNTMAGASVTAEITTTVSGPCQTVGALPSTTSASVTHAVALSTTAACSSIGLATVSDKDAEEREISRLLDTEDDDMVVNAPEDIGCPLLDESILDKDDGGQSAGDDDGVGGGQTVEETKDTDIENNDGLNLSIRRLSRMSLNADEEEEDGERECEQSLCELRVLEIANLPSGFSLDQIQKQLQREVGPVSCAEQLSPTCARFICECGAERAARFLCQALDAAQRTLLLGPAPEFRTSHD